MSKENAWWQTITFDFVKISKDLFRMPQYSNLSTLAKLLYGFLLDRTSLSAANGETWTDEAGDCFVYFPITEIMERFGCGHDKAAALLQELERARLITRTLKNRGRPFTEKELVELDAKVAKTYLSRENYIRAVLAGYEIMEAPDVDARELIKQVLRVGTNLNHLVFLAQCQNFIDVPELRKMANAIWECHRAMMKAYTPPSVRKKIWKEED